MRGMKRWLSKKKKLGIEYRVSMVGRRTNSSR
jgi:hypothetical protein